MKQLLLSIGILIPVISYAADWRNPASSRSELIDTIMLADNILIGYGAADREYIQSFQLKINQLQDQLKFQLALYQSTHKKSDLLAIKMTLQSLQAEEEQALQNIQKNLDPRTYQKLRAELHILQYEASRLLDIFGVKEKLARWLAKYGSQWIKNQLNVNNKHKDDIAYARQDAELSAFEQEFRASRMPYVKKGLAQFFGRELPDSKLCTIGFAGTGGGYRAMILTIGYARALEKLGLLDATMYMTSLSGSTWFLAPWTISQKSVNEYKELMLAKVRDDHFNMAELSHILCSNPIRLINDIVWPKFVFGQSVSSVDLYGALLATILFSDLGDTRHRQHLSDQMDYIKGAGQPFPIYTSVSMTKNKKTNEYGYNWYEFNPVEIRNLEYDAYIPSWAFDCPFQGGHSLEIAPEQSMGYLMGIFGSAYTVNFADLNRMMAIEVEKVPSWCDPMERVKFQVTQHLVSLMSDIPYVGKKRFSPAEVNNPFTYADLKLPSWLEKRDEIVLVDAGISYNIPVRPFYRPARKVNVIIIGESSGNVLKAKELKKVFADIKAFYGYEYTRVDDGSYTNLHMYKDKVHPEAPRIIYINFINDPKLLAEGQNNPELHQLIVENKLDSFDAKNCLDSHCDTFNFDYNEEQFLQLAGIAEFNILAHTDRIRSFIEAECLT